MTLATRSSSLNDTTSRQFLGVLGALAAMVLALGIAVQVAPLIATGIDAGGGAVSNDTYMSAPGISDPAGEHSGWGVADFDWYRGWQQAPSQAEPLRPFVPPGR